VRDGLYDRALAVAELVLSRTTRRPEVAVVLGSGLGAFAEAVTAAVAIPYDEIPHFPRATAVGHAGRLVVGRSGNVDLVVLQGRAHQYEGYSAEDVAFPMRVLACMGVRAVVITNAAGGIDPGYTAGALVVVRDHINLTGRNPLVGGHDERLGPRFPDMGGAYSARFREIALEEAKRLGLPPREGVYAGVLGPSFETPAEIEFLGRIGADLVGMSTVAEAIVARQMGLRVLAISCVTNMAAGKVDQPITQEEVLETTDRVMGEFTALLKGVLPRIAAEVG
jgi:purine-nucleoside phosphorylase